MPACVPAPLALSRLISPRTKISGLLRDVKVHVIGVRNAADFDVRIRTTWAESLHRSRGLSDDGQPISDGHVGVSRRAGRQLDDRKRTPRAGEPAGADSRSDVDDTALAIGKDDVDGEPHAERVDGLTGRDDQCGPFGQAITFAPAHERLPVFTREARRCAELIWSQYMFSVRSKMRFS